MTQKEDHDLLIEIHSDIRHLVKNFEQHLEEDSKLKKQVEFHQKLVYAGFGIFAFMGFVSKFIK